MQLDGQIITQAAGDLIYRKVCGDRRLVGAYLIRFVRFEPEQAVSILLGIDRNRPYSQLLACSEHPDCDLAAVCDKNAFEFFDVPLFDVFSHNYFFHSL